MAARKKTQRKLRLESLEQRALLDGMVLAALDARTGILALTGDARDNGVEITTEEIGGAWHMKIAGADSTWIGTRANPKGTRVNRQDWVSFPVGNVKGISIDMKDGRNSVRVSVEAGPGGGNLVLAKDFRFQAGKHLDCLFVRGIDVQGNLNIRTGAGGDTVELGAAIEVDEAFQFVPVNVAGTITIDLGPGNNSLQMRGTVGRDLAISTGTGIDSVFLAAGVGGNLRVNMGPNEDTLSVAPFVEIPGPPTTARVGGNVTVNMGDGNNLVLFDAQVAGNLTITGGKHRDLFQIGPELEGMDPVSDRLGAEENSPQPAMTIQGNLNLDTGNGDDIIVVAAEFQGRSTVRSGAGDDSVSLMGGFQGSVAVDSGAGMDYVWFSGFAVANVDIKTGAGWDGVWVHGLVGGNLSIDTGAESAVVAVSSNVGGSVSVKTGDGDDTVTIASFQQDGWEGEEPEAAFPPEIPVDGIQGSLLVDTGAGNDQVRVLADVQGNVSIKTGAGDDDVEIGPFQQDDDVEDDVEIGSWDPGNAMTIGGSLLIDTGAGDDGASVVNVVVAASGPNQKTTAAASAGGDVRIALGEGGELFANPNEESDIPYLATEHLRIWGLQAAGRLTVDGGNGDNAIALLQCSAAHVDVVNGAGSSLVAIGQLDLKGTGNLSIKSGTGDHGVFIGARFGWNEFFPVVDPAAYGVLASSVTIQTSSLYSGHVTIEDSNIDRSLAINVKGGDARIAMSNVQGLPDGSGRVGQVSIQTSAGNDSVAIDALAADRALASLGAGDDLLACGNSGDIASAVLDGGPGNRDRYEGPTFPNWQFKNFEEMPAP